MSTTFPHLRPTAMTALQNRWYRCLTDELPLSSTSFQLVAPTTLAPRSDAGLWTAQDVIPPRSLTSRRDMVGGDTAFAEYVAAARQMVFPQASFARDIGESNYVAWTAYLATFDPLPPANQQPALFASWALIQAPGVRGVGVADLTEIAVIEQGQAALDPYLGPDRQMPDYAQGYDDLLAALPACAGAGIAFDSATTSGDVRSTWTGGIDTGVQGLWSGLAANAPISARFAASCVTVDVRVEHWTTWAPAPGAWYDSALLNMAFAGAGSPPWPADPQPTWRQLFGRGGSMRRMLASLVVVDGVQATIVSDAQWSAAEWDAIRANSARGLWPFYLPDDGQDVTTSVRLQDGLTTIELATRAGRPLLLGQNVLSIAAYLGRDPGR